MEEKNILTFQDEDGNDIEFELVDSFELNGQDYAALLPPDDEDESEVLLMRIESESSGEDILVYIEDDAELDEVFNTFKDRMKDEFDFLD